MKSVLIVGDPLDREQKSWETHEVYGDFISFLMDRFSKWPQSAKIYHRYVSQAHDVTPFDVNSTERLKDLDGPFIIIVYPEGILEIIAIIVLVAVTAAAFLFK